jgi:hypothetical protein
VGQGSAQADGQQRGAGHAPEDGDADKGRVHALRVSFPRTRSAQATCPTRSWLGVGTVCSAG